jgi:hypothetical protein
VVFLYLLGRPLWLRRVNSVESFTGLLDWTRTVLDDGVRPLPPALAECSFAWTGGGEGPAPPIEP